MLGVVKALAALDPAGCGLDDVCAQLEGSTYVMADEARPQFSIDAVHRWSYRQDLLGASCTLRNLARCGALEADALRAKLSAFQQPFD